MFFNGLSYLNYVSCLKDERKLHDRKGGDVAFVHRPRRIPNLSVLRVSQAKKKVRLVQIKCSPSCMLNAGMESCPVMECFDVYGVERICVLRLRS